MAKISLDFFFANSPTGNGKSWTPQETQLIFDETQKYFKEESEEVKKRMILYYRQQATSVFLHKVDQQFYKSVMKECLKNDKV